LTTFGESFAGFLLLLTEDSLDFEFAEAPVLLSVDLEWLLPEPTCESDSFLSLEDLSGVEILVFILPLLLLLLDVVVVGVSVVFFGIFLSRAGDEAEESTFLISTGLIGLVGSVFGLLMVLVLGVGGPTGFGVGSIFMGVVVVVVAVATAMILEASVFVVAGTVGVVVVGCGKLEEDEAVDDDGAFKVELETGSCFIFSALMMFGEPEVNLELLGMFT